jgi:hypothetical protein
VSEPFRKNDAGKPRFRLLDADFELGVVEVLTAGGDQYGDDNWQRGTRERYVDAASRHWNAYRRGELIDPDSGKPHLYHLTCCLMFLDWMDRREDKAIADSFFEPPDVVPTTWNVPLSVPR